jgi:3-mercaptopyruvate sulfurtransferase SseA
MSISAVLIAPDQLNTLQATEPVVVIDTRDADAFAAGHIPGAVNLNWTDAMDPQRQWRLQPDPVLRTMLEKRRITFDKEVIVYCQTHHRSAHTY